MLRIPPKTKQDSIESTAALRAAAETPFTPADPVEDSVATTVEALVTDYNGLLASLRAAGIIGE